MARVMERDQRLPVPRVLAPFPRSRPPGRLTHLNFLYSRPPRPNIAFSFSYMHATRLRLYIPQPIPSLARPTCASCRMQHSQCIHQFAEHFQREGMPSPCLILAFPAISCFRMPSARHGPMVAWLATASVCLQNKTSNDSGAQRHSLYTFHLES